LTKILGRTHISRPSGKKKEFDPHCANLGWNKRIGGMELQSQKISGRGRGRYSKVSWVEKGQVHLWCPSKKTWGLTKQRKWIRDDGICRRRLRRHFLAKRSKRTRGNPQGLGENEVFHYLGEERMKKLSLLKGRGVKKQSRLLQAGGGGPKKPF